MGQQQQQQSPAHMIGLANRASVEANTMTISSAHVATEQAWARQ
jgi:hypothetical protein